MDLERLFEELGCAAERAGVHVRQARFDDNLSDVRRPRGGLCTLRGDRLILVDAKLPSAERVGIVAEALARIDLAHQVLAPDVRATIAAHAKARPHATAKDVDSGLEGSRPGLRLVRSAVREGREG